MDSLIKFKIDDKICVNTSEEMQQLGIAGMRGYIYTCWPNGDGTQNCRVCLANQVVQTVNSKYLIKVE